jgi:hypothetical protein
MSRYLGLAAIVAVAASSANDALALALAGPRVFGNTNLIDDPGVTDQAILPRRSLQSDDGKSWVTDINVEYDITITENLGFGIGDNHNWITNDPNDFKKSHGGWEDLHVQPKYLWIVPAKHGSTGSIQVSQGFGCAAAAGIDSGCNATTFSGLFGKGLRDIPWDPIRSFAITGGVDFNIPNAIGKPIS